MFLVRKSSQIGFLGPNARNPCQKLGHDATEAQRLAPNILINLVIGIEQCL
jgi:hypothetical protein